MYALFLILLLLGGCAEPQKTPSPSLDLPDRAVVAFSGDVMQHLPQVAAARQADGSYDYTSVFAQVAPFWRAADFAVVNLETTLADAPPYTGYPMFRSPRALASALAAAGVTHAALANNHAMDASRRGVEQTLRALNDVSLVPVGIGDSVVLLSKGALRLALVNATYGTNGMPVPEGITLGLLDTVYLARQIAEARRREATHIVAFVHWGNEYQRRASDEQREWARWLVEQGVDAVVGSHPHVVQQIEPPVVYSLGNFVSNQRERYKRSGLSVRLTFYERVRGARIEFLPHYTAADYTVVTPRHDSLSTEFDDVRQTI